MPPTHSPISATILTIGTIAAALISGGALIFSATIGKGESTPPAQSTPKNEVSEIQRTSAAATDQSDGISNAATTAVTGVGLAAVEPGAATPNVDSATSDAQTELDAPIIQFEPTSIDLAVIPLASGAIESRHLLTVSLKAHNGGKKAVGLGIYGNATYATIGSKQFAPHRHDFRAPRGVCFQSTTMQCVSALANERLLIPAESTRTLVFRTVFESPPGDFASAEASQPVEIQLRYFLVDNVGTVVDEEQVLQGSLASVHR